MLLLEVAVRPRHNFSLDKAKKSQLELALCFNIPSSKYRLVVSHTKLLARKTTRLAKVTWFNLSSEDPQPFCIVLI